MKPFSTSIAIILISFSFSMLSCSSKTKMKEFYVRGNCEMCKERLETSLKSEKGIELLNYKIDQQTLVVKFDTTMISQDLIEKKCADLGHGTHNHPMNEAANEALPECCKAENNSAH
jgi:copper chaperone CopZ